jgi:methionyl-tRNA formyltransferase
MNIIFMGTPDFAVPSLEILLQSKHQVLAVVTAPDKPRGRGQKLSSTPVKKLADASNIPVIQVSDLGSPEFHSQLAALKADCYVVVAFRILPEEVFTIPPLKTFNLHASLLPAYRGAAPINWALINGEKQSGVTTFFIEKKVDTGTIIFQSSVDIDNEMTAGELHDHLALAGAELVKKTCDEIAASTVQSITQDDSLASPAPKIFRDTCKIDWNNSVASVHNLIRGLSPYPGAWTLHNEKELKIYRTRIVGKGTALQPGTLVQEDDKLFVACSDGLLEILEIKQEGRKAMASDAFLRGYSILEGDQLR